MTFLHILLILSVLMASATFAQEVLPKEEGPDCDHSVSAPEELQDLSPISNELKVKCKNTDCTDTSKVKKIEQKKGGMVSSKSHRMISSKPRKMISSKAKKMIPAKKVEMNE